MHRADEILGILDDSARAFVFPMLDNGYVYLAASRLTLFRSETDWAVVFEIFGFSPRAGFPDLAVTTIGSTLKRQKTAADFVSDEAFQNYLIHNPNWEVSFFSPIESDDWVDAENGEYLAPDAATLTVRGRSFSIPSSEALAEAGVDRIDDTRTHIFEVCRWLAFADRNAVLATDEERTVNIPDDMRVVAVLDDWNHPDVVDPDCAPSGNEDFQRIAHVLQNDDATGFTLGSGNTHWKNWPDGGSL